MGTQRGSLSTGTFVTNPKQPEWGPGVVVGVEGRNAWVVFREVSGRAAKRMRAAFLERAEIVSDPVLDNLPPATREGEHYVLPADRITLAETLARFLERYPGGFEDPDYLKNERDYKLRAHAELTEVVEARAETDPEPLAKGIQRALGRVGLLSPFEMMALADAYRSSPDTWVTWVDRAARAAAEPPSDDRFDALAAAVAALPAEAGKARVETWPIVTVLPYLLAPARHMLLKPVVSKRAGDRFGFDLHYSPHPSWPGYERLLQMGSLYLERLAPYGARDLVDVQSYFWHTGAFDDCAAKRRAKGNP